jgi:hypothetical protein
MNDELKLCEFLYKIDKPILFKNSLVFDKQSNRNSATKWTPENLKNVFQNKKLEYRVGKRSSCIVIRGGGCVMFILNFLLLFSSI